MPMLTRGSASRPEIHTSERVADKGITFISGDDATHATAPFNQSAQSKRDRFSGVTGMLFQREQRPFNPRRRNLQGVFAWYRLFYVEHVAHLPRHAFTILNRDTTGLVNV